MNIKPSTKHIHSKLTSNRTVLACCTLFFLVHWIGLSYKWYNKTWWVDIVMHFMGGMLVAMMAYAWKDVYAPKLGEVLPFWAYTAFGVGIVMIVGVGWEWFEFVHDLMLDPLRADIRLQLGVFDTLKDLGIDFIGGILMSLGIVIKESRR